MRMYELVNEYDRSNVIRQFGAELQKRYGNSNTITEIIQAIEDQDESYDKKNTIRTIKRLLNDS